MCVLFSFDFPYDSACSRRETDLREREGEEMGVGGVIAGKSVLGEGWGGGDCKSFVLLKVIVDGSAVARRH